MGNSSEQESASEQVIGVLRDEFRATPLLLRERTGLRKQRVNRVLNRLRAEGRVVKVTRGLYEIDEDFRRTEQAHRRDGEGAVGKCETGSDAISSEINPDDLEFGSSQN